MIYVSVTVMVSETWYLTLSSWCSCAPKIQSETKADILCSIIATLG